MDLFLKEILPFKHGGSADNAGFELTVENLAKSDVLELQKHTLLYHI